MVTHDAGSTWNKLKLGARVHMPSSDAADSLHAAVAPDKMYPEIYATSDAGRSWDTLTVPDSLSNSIILHVAMPLPRTVIGLAILPEGGRGIVRSDDWGTTWSTYRSAPSGATRIVFIDSLNGWLTGGSRPDGSSVDTAVIARTTDGGMSWQVQLLEPLPSKSPLTDIGFADALHGLAVGGMRHIYRTTNGGIDWVMEANVLTEGTLARLLVAMPTAETGVVVTTQGIVLRRDRASAIHEWSSIAPVLDRYAAVPTPVAPGARIQLPIMPTETGPFLLTIHSLDGALVRTVSDAEMQVVQNAIQLMLSEDLSGFFVCRIQSSRGHRSVPIIIRP